MKEDTFKTINKRVNKMMKQLRKNKRLKYMDPDLNFMEFDFMEFEMKMTKRDWKKNRNKKDIGRRFHQRKTQKDDFGGNN